ncbi:MAG: metallophosphoesterase, partial [Spirochaetia bacterium]|nr:metallophosphoesterase [Spirochaetia bacterium]
THNQHKNINVPDGDFIIHCGDVSSGGYKSEIKSFVDWFSNLPHRNKIMIPGNHDFLFEEYYDVAKNMVDSRGIVCLIDSGIEIEGIKFWGSPITPYFNNWAFNRFRGSSIEQHWNKIPEGIDVLLTHGPPAHLQNYLSMTLEGEDVGCEDLYTAIQRIKPKINAFGHIHEGYGTSNENGVIYINCSILNRRYKIHNKPVEVLYEDGRFSLY